MKGAVVVAGSIAQRPGQGGHAWALLQWVLGFRRLGWKVLFLDRLDAGMAEAEEPGTDLTRSPLVSDFVDVMRRFGLMDDCALLLDEGGTVGIDRNEVGRRVAEADFLIDIMGFLGDADLLAMARRRVFLDIDPGFGQMWQALGQHDAFSGHDDFVTLGLNIGQPGCRIPTCGRQWVPTLHPISLRDWPFTEPDGTAFTSIGAWRGPYASIEYEGESFGLRCHEFRRFLDLPRRTGLRFEMALDIDPAETADLERLRGHGWHLLDPRRAAPDMNAYRTFIQRSGAEFMVAKNLYVRSRSGWFSDRSIAYMSSGRPVLGQDTGLRGHIPADAGLVLFDTPDDAAAGAEAIRSAPLRHARAARELAVEYFDSDIVLNRLVARLGANRVRAA